MQKKEHFETYDYFTTLALHLRETQEKPLNCESFQFKPLLKRSISALPYTICLHLSRYYLVSKFSYDAPDKKRIIFHNQFPTQLIVPLPAELPGTVGRFFYHWGRQLKSQQNESLCGSTERSEVLLDVLSVMLTLQLAPEVRGRYRTLFANVNNYENSTVVFCPLF